MSDLIRVDYSGDKPAVSARELHEFLEVGTEYRHWFSRMCEYGFTEGQDFRSFLTESTGGRRGQDAAITIDMANSDCGPANAVRRTLCISLTRGRRVRFTG